MTTSYLIYDFETDGVDPRTCRPLQVAWQRFNMDLQPIEGEDPVDLAVNPARTGSPSPSQGDRSHRHFAGAVRR